MTKRNHYHDHDHDADRDIPANDNDANKAPVVVTPAAGAMVSLAELATALNGVDMSSVAGRSGHPMLQFKSREANGTWMIGQRKIKPESGSRWAIDPRSFQRGFACFGDANNFLGEKLQPVSKPMLDPTKLPETGFKWQEQWSVNMKCLDGADAGVEVVFKSTTVGGIQAINGVLELVRDRLNGGQHDGNVVPIALLEKDYYSHGQHGKTWFPVLTHVDWMPLQGPAPAPVAPPPPVSPPSSPPPAEQPRRRRVG
jgi:hypothetical protein